jgi:hypothetical protein
MHLHIGLAEFLVFALYYLILKAALQFANVEARRNGLTVLAGLTGLFA